MNVLKNNLIPLLTCSLALWSLSGAPVAAQETENDLQSWSMVTLTTPIGHSKWKAYGEIQPRIGNDIGHMERLLIRPAIGYQVTPHWSLWQGYGWTPLLNPGFRDEHRLFQQSLLEHQVGQWKIINRTRLEERFIERAGDTAIRARHMLRVTHPIGESKKYYWVGLDEAFVNLNDTNAGPKAGFDQNRLFTGVGRNLSKHAKLEGGYMFNYVNRPDPAADRINHVVLVSLMFNL